MAENYKHLYHQMKKMVEQYQDVIVPGLREQLAKRVEVVRCRECKHWMYMIDDVGLCVTDVPDIDGVVWPAYGFCCYGERRADGNDE